MLSCITNQVKLTMVGDSLTGKTCIIDAYITKKYNPSLISTPCEYYTQDIELNGKVYNTVLLDTSGLEDHDKLRSYFHKNTSCFIVCYDISNRKSFENVKCRWYPMLKKSLKVTPFILIGTKSDERTEHGKNNLIKHKEGQKLAKNLKAAAFVECSAKEMINLDQVFFEAILSISHTQQPEALQTCQPCVIS